MLLSFFGGEHRMIGPQCSVISCGKVRLWTMDAQNLFGAVQTRKLGWTLIQKYSMHFAYHRPVPNGVVGSYVVVLLHGYPRIWGGKNSKFSTAIFLSTENPSPWKLMGTQLHIPSKLQLQFHDLHRFSSPSSWSKILSENLSRTLLRGFQAYVMVLPLMFLTGMVLVDTLNGLFMAWLYGQSSNSMQRLRLGIAGITYSVVFDVVFRGFGDQPWCHQAWIIHGLMMINDD